MCMRPTQPRHKAAELNSSALQHSEILADYSKVALIEIAKWRQGGVADHFAEDRLGCIAPCCIPTCATPGSGCPSLSSDAGLL